MAAADEGDGAAPGAAPPSRLARAIGASVWASFLAACAGTMFFFAFVAPEDLVGDFAPDDHIDRIGVYTLGFFGLWLLAALASALAIYLHGEPARPGEP